MKSLMHFIGNNARVASKIRLNSKIKNKILIDYLKLIKKMTAHGFCQKFQSLTQEKNG